jgi:lipopolysaccharide/colanic/teichoic acid biosynthesis glycosyltransferase
MSAYNRSVWKRAFDLLLAVPGLIVISPVLLIAACAIFFDDGGPVFFKQVRVGRDGKLFKIWKYRTMVVNAEKSGGQLTVGGDRRVTRVGKLLRKTKLDELPQLFNVIAGEMSMVGPRPEVPRYVEMYAEGQRQVLALNPGITDEASIKYRAESEVLAQSTDPERTYVEELMPEKIELNMQYARHASMATDIMVILRTIGKLF